MSLCPCGTDKNYADCCGLYIDQSNFPPTPEALMRSRYSAYTRQNVNYIARTMKAPALDGFDAKASLQWARRVTWRRLEVLGAQMEGEQGQVEFKVYYREEGEDRCLHERSEFRREGQQWYYLDGRVPEVQSSPPAVSTKIPRNDPCPCGSQKKYKKCCGA